MSMSNCKEELMGHAVLTKNRKTKTEGKTRGESHQ